MKNNKGISMITLIVTIIVIIIIIGLTYRTGSKYISTSKDTENESLKSIISSAVKKRQSDLEVSSLKGTSTYAGYPLGSGEFYEISKQFEDSDNDIPYGPGLWYIIDAKNASNLGVIDAEKYLVEDVRLVQSDEKAKVAVADYYTGKVHIIELTGTEFEQKYNEALHNECPKNKNGGGHVYTVATCTEPPKCIYCGVTNGHALQHEYDPPTCLEDSVCKRCGMVIERTPYGSHDYDMENGHWSGDLENHYRLCKRCGAKGLAEKHNLTYTPNNNWTHTLSCSVCQIPLGVQECHKEYEFVNADNHRIVCKDCGHADPQSHFHDNNQAITYIYVDKDEHKVHCKECDTDLFNESHIDSQKPFGICDVCGGVMNLSKKPALVGTGLTMYNSNPIGESQYYAKKDNIIIVRLEVDSALAESPKLKIQGKLITTGFTNNPEVDPNVWTASVNTSAYDFVNGRMNIEVTNIKSLWGVYADPITATSDGRYVTYDDVQPGIVYIP